MQRPACLVVLLLILFADVQHLVSANDRIVDTKEETMSNGTTAAATSCITNCTCSRPQLNDLMIDCFNLTDGKSSSVLEEIDRLLPKENLN